MATCPDCDAPVPRRVNLYVGELLACPECGIALEVVSLKPFTVDYYTGEVWGNNDEEEES